MLLFPYSLDYKASPSRALFSSSTSSSSSQQQQQEPPPLPDTKDPFLLLGLSPPTADKTQIKRAYKRMALRYHPDVRINSSSTAEEKKRANDDFARINDAYNRLTSTDTSTANGGTSTKSSSSTYTPPHRRSASTTTTAGNNPSTNKYTWEDYNNVNNTTNKNDDDDYNTGGDSFKAIFTDLFSSLADNAAGVVAEGVRRGKQQKTGILHDLIEFLEQSGSFPNDMSSSSSSSSSSTWKDDVLEPQTIQDISLELDDTKLLITQLEKKLQNLEETSRTLEGQLQVEPSIRFVEKMDIQIELDEVLARKNIVLGYLNKSKTRYGILQQKYKELTLQARRERNYDTVSSKNDDSYYSSRRIPRVDKDDNKSTTTTTKTASSSYNPSMDTTSNPSTISENVNSSSSTTSTWKRESFGRRSSRVSSSQTKAKDAPSSFTEKDIFASRDSDLNTNYSNKKPSSIPSQQQGSNTKNVVVDTVSSLPPHRRITSRSTNSYSSSSNSTNDVKKRLREIKVDEDFEKLKREMGL